MASTFVSEINQAEFILLGDEKSLKNCHDLGKFCYFFVAWAQPCGHSVCVGGGIRQSKVQASFHDFRFTAISCFTPRGE